MESNKENQEQAEAASVSVASPRISSVGAPSEDAGRGGEGAYAHGGGGQSSYVMTAGLDHLHWGGVAAAAAARAHDARSVASSAAADRDDKSVYDMSVMEPGALDAPEGGCRGLGALRGPQQGLREGALRVERTVRRRRCGREQVAVP